MPNFPSVFPLWWIALTAGVALVVSILLLRWRLKEFSFAEALLVATIVGLSVFFWRLSGNIKELNDDPLPPFSPNDWLCPLIVYVALGVYSRLRAAISALKGWEQARAWLT